MNKIFSKISAEHSLNYMRKNSYEYLLTLCNLVILMMIIIIIIIIIIILIILIILIIVIIIIIIIHRE